MEPFSKRWAARAGIALASCTVAVGAVATATVHAEGEPSLSASTRSCATSSPLRLTSSAWDRSAMGGSVAGSDLVM